MRVTLNNIAKAIKEKHGHDVELVRGNGYHYFSSTSKEPQRIDFAEATSVYSMHTTSFSIDRWVSEYETLIEDAHVPTAEETARLVNEDGSPKVIKLYGRKF